MPFSATISFYFDKYYFTPQINSILKKLKPYTKEIEKPEIQTDSFWSKLSNTIENTKNSLSQIQEDAKFYISHATDIINALISLASLYLAQFLLNILLLPLLLIYIIKNLKLE
jgi:predicted PurR-regulated permease PerM